MTARPNRLRDERGVAMALVVFAGAMLIGMGVLITQIVASEVVRSASAVKRQAAFEAAEAGIDDYISKLLDDRQYYAHTVHPAEGTRRSEGGTLVSPGATWSHNLVWTYPNGTNAWRTLPNGYQYSLRVTPPSVGDSSVTIVSTGRKVGSTTDVRVIEAKIVPSSIADFQMIANASISYGSAATTQGKIYAGIDSSGTAHSVTHNGTAHADIYAEGSIYGSTNMQSGAQKYPSSTIRTKIKNPISFAGFLASIVDIQRAATAGGLSLDSPSVAAWRLTLQSNGTIAVQQCSINSGHAAAATPTCGTATTHNVPANGAVYAGQTVIVQGQVQGRYTITSNDDIVISGDITYVTPGEDTLGLVAHSDVLVAQWAPYNLSWRAATLAQSGSWRSWSGSTTKGTMTFTGSTATAQGGYMSMFATRYYNYDTTLQYLTPPWFPTLDEAYTISLFRELPAG